MLIEGTKILPRPRQEVWTTLNDPAFLQTTVPGCRRVAEPHPDQLTMELTSAVGPIKVNFNIDVQRLEVRAPESYVLRGTGSAGVAGSATGQVTVRLAEVPGGTQLDYSAQTEITGRMAQLGSRLIDGAARKFSEEFFANVARAMNGATPGAAPTPMAAGAGAALPASTAAVSTAAAPTSAPPGAAQGSGAAPRSLADADMAILRLALESLAWRVAFGCAIGSFLGGLAAFLVLRSTS